MSIQWNTGWRVFEKGISIYRHYCSKLTNIKYIKKKGDNGTGTTLTVTGTTLTGTGTTCGKRGSGHSVPVPH